MNRYTLSAPPADAIDIDAVFEEDENVEEEASILEDLNDSDVEIEEEFPDFGRAMADALDTALPEHGSAIAFEALDGGQLNEDGAALPPQQPEHQAEATGDIGERVLQ